MPRRGMKTYPAHGPKNGRGARIDDATGFLREADNYVVDRRQGLTSRETADLTPGFGTYHPQDVRRTPPSNDPKPVPRPRSDGNPDALSAKDLGFSDADVRAAIRAGVPLRRS